MANCRPAAAAALRRPTANEQDVALLVRRRMANPRTSRPCGGPRPRRHQHPCSPSLFARTSFDDGGLPPSCGSVSAAPARRASTPCLPGVAGAVGGAARSTWCRAGHLLSACWARRETAPSPLLPARDDLGLVAFHDGRSRAAPACRVGPGAWCAWAALRPITWPPHRGGHVAPAAGRSPSQTQRLRAVAAGRRRGPAPRHGGDLGQRHQLFVAARRAHRLATTPPSGGSDRLVHGAGSSASLHGGRCEKVARGATFPRER